MFLAIACPPDNRRRDRIQGHKTRDTSAAQCCRNQHIVDGGITTRSCSPSARTDSFSWLDAPELTRTPDPECAIAALLDASPKTRAVNPARRCQHAFRESVIRLRSCETRTGCFAVESGRGIRIRTRGLRIWNPLLYQLSYTPTTVCGLARRSQACKTQSARMPPDLDSHPPPPISRKHHHPKEAS
jgi:hypothetical protein